MQGLVEWRDDIELGDGDADCLIVSICKKRRHRSVAGKYLTYEARDVLKGYFGTKVAPLQGDPMPKHMCDQSCIHCTWPRTEKQFWKSLFLVDVQFVPSKCPVLGGFVASKCSVLQKFVPSKCPVLEGLVPSKCSVQEKFVPSKCPILERLVPSRCSVLESLVPSKCPVLERHVPSKCSVLEKFVPSKCPVLEGLVPRQVFPELNIY